MVFGTVIYRKGGEFQNGGRPSSGFLHLSSSSPGKTHPRLHRFGWDQRLNRDFETLTSSNDIRVELLGLLEDRIDGAVVVVWVVVKQNDFLGFRLERAFNGLFPSAVAPSFMPGQFFRCVLGVDDQTVCVFGEFPEIVLTPFGTSFDVCAVGNNLVALCDPVSHTTLRMVQFLHEDCRVCHAEGSFHQIDVIPHTG